MLPSFSVFVRGQLCELYVGLESCDTLAAMLEMHLRHQSYASRSSSDAESASRPPAAIKEIIKS